MAKNNIVAVKELSFMANRFIGVAYFSTQDVRDNIQHYLAVMLEGVNAPINIEFESHELASEALHKMVADVETIMNEE